MDLMKRIGGRTFLFFVSAAAVFAPSAAADTVKLDNGDRITGAVRKLAGGKLTIDTAYAGPIEIEWSAVSRLAGAGNFDIRTSAGRIYTGTIERADDKLSIAGVDGAQEIDINDVSGFAAVTEKPRAAFRENVKVGFDWGYNLTRGNASLTQSALGANAQYADSKQKLSGIVTSIRSRQGNAATNRHAGDARYDRFINERLFAYGLGGVERNSRKLLALRAKLGGGFGLKLVKDKATTVSLLGGANYSRENYFPGEAGANVSANSGEGTAGLEITAVRFGGIEFASRLLVFGSSTGSGRYRFEYDGSVRLPVFKNFSYGLSFYDRYDSRPAVAVKKNDYGLISALGYTF